MPEPGWIPKHTQEQGSHECMRLAISCVTGIHWRRLRFLDPNDYSINWWEEWDKLLRERGFHMYRTTRAEAEEWGGFWIAGVDSYVYPGKIHSVVMKGKKLHYDSGQVKRKRAPTKLRDNPLVCVPLEVMDA
jgi:hypothetical protein